jgi:hypothetical protein
LLRPTAHTPVRCESVPELRSISNLGLHFNLTVELQLMTFVRGFSWTGIPIASRNRRNGVAKAKIKEMGARSVHHALRVARNVFQPRRFSEDVRMLMGSQLLAIARISRECAGTNRMRWPQSLFWQSVRGRDARMASRVVK